MAVATRVQTSAGESRNERRLTGLQWLAILVPALACLALSLHTLSRPHVLTGIQTYGGGGYDDGLHVGAALRLTSLELPYRDYVFLHPPGIAVLLWPVAVVGRLLSEQDAMALGRLLVTAFSVANVALVAWLVRKRGPVAMLAAGTFLALSPLTVATTRTTLHEPFMILFVLLGMAALFPENELAPKNRTSLAGLFFGLALSIKLLAFLPVVAVFIVLLRLLRLRRSGLCAPSTRGAAVRMVLAHRGRGRRTGHAAGPRISWSITSTSPLRSWLCCSVSRSVSSAA